MEKKLYSKIVNYLLVLLSRIYSCFLHLTDDILYIKKYPAFFHFVIPLSILMLFLIPNTFGQSYLPKLDSSLISFSPQTPGVAVVLVKGDKVIYKKTVGLANIEHQIPINNKTIFPLASVTKQFTAYAIAQLIETGKINLDDDVRSFIPELPDYGVKITIAHLLFHNSGLRDDFELFLLAGYDYIDFQSNERALNLIFNQTSLSFPPGAKFEYNNAGYTLLAEIISRVTKVQFSEWMEKKVFKPAGMRSSIVKNAVSMIVLNTASAYNGSNDELVFKHEPLVQDMIGPAGIYSSIDDMGNWLIYLNKNYTANNDLIHDFQQTNTLNNNNGINYGYGLFKNKLLGRTQYSHSGNSGSFLSYTAWLPEEQIGVVVLSNYYPEGNPVTLGEKILRLYLGENGNSDFPASSNIPALKQKTLARTIDLSANQLKAFCGTYWQADQNYIRKIVLEEDTLRYVRNENSKSSLLPVGNNEFVMLGTHSLLLVRFEQLSDGNQKMWVTVNNQSPTEYVVSKEEANTNHNELLASYAGTYFSRELLKGYELILKDNALYVKSLSQPEKRLNPTIKDHFNPGSPWWFGYDVHFIRDEKNEISGFKVQQFHAKNVWFEKLD